MCNKGTGAYNRERGGKKMGVRVGGGGGVRTKAWGPEPFHAAA